MEHVARYLPTIKALAEKALDMAVDASPTKPREGELVRSLMVGVPIGKVLLGANAGVQSGINDLVAASQAAGQNPDKSKCPSVRFVDGYGHHRLIYWLLLLDLALRAAEFDHPALNPLPATCAMTIGALGLTVNKTDASNLDLPTPEAVFGHLCSSRFVSPEIPTYGDSFFDVVFEHRQQNGSFYSPSVEVSPDESVYRELIFLHAMFGFMTLNPNPHLREISRDSAAYHLQHTQPDYTTNQPWALAAFLWFPETVGFAEQQLHDVQTHLSIEGPAGALVPGLLLADAYATLRELLEKPSE